MNRFVRLLALYRPYLGWMLLGALLSVLALLANVGLMALSGWFITAMGLAGAGGAAINYFTPAAIIRGLAMARTAGRYGERIVTHEATFRLVARLRVWLFGHIEPLAPAGLHGLHSGDLLSRVQKDVDRLDSLYLRILLPIAVAVVALLLFGAFAASYSLQIALALLGLLLVGALALPLWAMRQARLPGAAQVRLSAQLRTQVIDSVQGLAELINAGADRRYAQAIDALSDEWLAAQDRLNRINSLNSAALGLLAGLAVWAVLLLGIPLLQSQALSGPQLTMLVLFALASFEAVMPLPLALQVWSETGAAAERLFAITDQRSATREPAHPRPLPPGNELVFDNVSLRYPGSDSDALRDIALTLPAGSRTLLLGESGAGKSSLVDLLLRFRDPSSGSIRLDGCDLRELRSEQLRTRISVVSQHTHLFNASIRDNLLLAAPQAGSAQLEAACRAAQVHDFIAAQPDGYDTWLGETGVKVSGGQARRIAIARALLKDAPILVLDEPTEGLDNRTALALCRTLEDVMRDRTVLVISHRSLPLGGITQTLTLRAGRVVEIRAQPAD